MAHMASVVFGVLTWGLCDAHPWIGLGLAGNLDQDAAGVANAVEMWLRLGGRAFDTALMYGHDEGLREGLRRSQVPDADVFITSKIPPERMGFEATLRAAEELQQRLGRAVDCLMIHWPGRPWPKRSSDPDCVKPRGSGPGDWSECRRATWQALMSLKSSGAVRFIGVSNYERPHLAELEVLPDVLQLEFHPWWRRGDLLSWSREHGVQLVAYGSLGGVSSDWLRDGALSNLADEQGLTVAQLLLNWAVSQGVSVIPSARSEEHMRQNLECCGQKLSQRAVGILSSQPEAMQRRIQPDPRFIMVPGVSIQDFGGPVPPSHARLDLFGAVDQLHMGALRRECWHGEFQQYPCCHPSFGPRGLASCWEGGFDFLECCLPPGLKLALGPLPRSLPQEAVDFIVVGAGSAGSVVASRLARRGFVVALLESGGSGYEAKADTHPNPSAPDQADHWYVNDIEWGLGKVTRSTQMIHGRGLGGSSSVNGRYHTRTYLPFDQKAVLQAYEDVEADLELQPEDVDVARPPWPAILTALQQAGVPYLPNASMSLDGPSVGPAQKVTRCRRTAAAPSSYSCALGQSVDRVRVFPRAHVARVTFRGGVAQGVEVVGSSGLAQVASRHGVVLSSGALQTPTILQRSGVGSREDVERLGIQQQVEIPEVGGQLQDHLYLRFRLQMPVSCTEAGGSIYAFYSSLSGRSRKRSEFELQMIPKCASGRMELKSFLILLRSRSLGRVLARSMDSSEPPGVLLDPFAGNASDVWSLLTGLRELYRLLRDAWPELSFDPPFTALMEDSFAGQHCAQVLGSWQHPMATAQLGAVLDPELRVRGVRKLWVADASALPDWALAGHPDAGIRALGSLAASFAAKEALGKG